MRLFLLSFTDKKLTIRDTFNLGHFREEGGGQKPNFPNCLVIFLRKFLQKGVLVLTFPIILYTNLILEHKFVFLQSFSSLRVVESEKMAFVISKMN